jgi:hypothetical protein
MDNTSAKVHVVIVSDILEIITLVLDALVIEQSDGLGTLEIPLRFNGFYDIRQLKMMTVR